MARHELKTDPLPFWDVAESRKTFEIRKNDRNFQVGDVLFLQETKHSSAAMLDGGAPLAYTGSSFTAHVKHIMRGPIYGLADGWVVMSIEPFIGIPQTGGAPIENERAK